MAKLDKFIDWLQSIPENRESFEEDARERFQEIQDATAGWAANGLMHVLNCAVYEMDDGEEYLEIGTYGGRSLVAALQDCDKRARVIDPFANTAEGVRPAWEKAVDQFGVRDRITLYETFAEQFDDELPPIGVFFYDGNHDAGHTYEGLVRFEKYLADKAIIIVDDYAIPGGGNQQVYPGHVASSLPVKADTDRWITENSDRATLITVTPWTFQQAIIRYERN